LGAALTKLLEDGAIAQAPIVVSAVFYRTRLKKN
jgi:hypothetical protein